MSEKIEFRARLVRYLGLDRPYRIELNGDSITLGRDHDPDAGSVAGSLAAAGGLVGGLAGSLIDRSRQRKRAATSATSGADERIVARRSDFTKNTVSVSPQTMDAMIGNKRGEWRFRLSSRTKYRFVFEDEAELNQAIHALSRFFGSDIKVKAKWNDKRKRYDPKGWFG